MESTYPEIYMNPWQEMRQMQNREERRGESCQVRMTLAQSSCLGKFGSNGDGCGRGGSEGGHAVVTDGDDGDGGKGGGGDGGGFMSASIPGSLIALHQSCPALT